MGGDHASAATFKAAEPSGPVNVHQLRSTPMPEEQPRIVLGTPGRYVLGFAFSKGRDHAMMIFKQRPDYLKNQWAGVGGKIEPGETPLEAMHRECREEAGIDVAWRGLAEVRTPDDRWHVWAYRAMDDRIWDAKKMTDEPIAVLDLASLTLHRSSRLTELSSFLLPLALRDEVRYGIIERG